MPWCPICKNEYRKGIAVCADCKAALVEQLEEAADQSQFLIDLEDEESAKKLVSYLEYSKIPASYLQKEETGCYSVFVPKQDFKEAKKAFRAFYTVEMAAEYENRIKEAIKAGNDMEDIPQAEGGTKECGGFGEESKKEGDLQDILSEEEAGESCEEELQEDILYGRQTSYVPKAEKSEDYKSSAVTFTIFGVCGLVLMLLQFVGVFQYFSTLSSVIMTVMFAVFLLIGADSFKRAAIAKAEAKKEESFVKELNEWLDQNLTLEMLKEADQETLSKEANFLNEIAKVKQMITKQFGALDPAFLDQFAEDYYNSHFEDS